MFTDWKRANINQVWLKRLAPEGISYQAEPELFGATLAKGNVHPLPNMSAENCTEQMGICGPWFERMPHFRLEFTPSSGEELQSEYILPRQYALEAFRLMHGLRDHIAPRLQISEIRSIAADELWMSPCYQQDCVAIHFTWKKDWDAVQQVLPMIENALAPLQARPHWGKLFTMTSDRLLFLFEKLSAFRQLLQRFDPDGKFRNVFLDKYIFAD